MFQGCYKDVLRELQEYLKEGCYKAVSKMFKEVSKAFNPIRPRGGHNVPTGSKLVQNLQNENSDGPNTGL